MTPWAPPDIHRRSTMFGERPSALSSALLSSYPPAISSYSPFQSAIHATVCPRVVVSPLSLPRFFHLILRFCIRCRCAHRRTISVHVKWNILARASEHVYVCNNTKESVAEKGDGGGGRRNERGGIPKGEVVSGGGRRGEAGGGGRRDHAALSSINLSAAVV